MRALVQNDSGLKPFPTDSVNAGYMVGDEWDMTHPASDCSRPWQSAKAAFPADGRAKYANFGKGVAFWNTDVQAACWVNSVDIPSNDVYWFAGSNECGAGEGGNKAGVFKQNNCHNAANYGWTVNRMRSLVSPLGSKPVWNFVEVGCPFTQADEACIQQAQLRAATWHSFIAGARAVSYFNHSFKAGAGGGTCGSASDTIRDCPAVRSWVTALNAEIQGLATVLNSLTLTGGLATSGNVKALGKWDGAKLYVLAGATPGAGSVQFSLPSCVGNATATALNESRTVPVSGGAWTDTFANDNTVHLYRIDGGSTCGLT